MASTETTGVVHHCRRAGCHRPLNSPESIARGMGPTCARRAAAEAAAVARACEGYKPEQVAKAKAAIRDGNVRPMGNGLYLVKSSRTDEKYCSDGVSCVCPAGARSHSLRCWHLLAISITQILAGRTRQGRPASRPAIRTTAALAA